jgi:two-component system, cell cycle response regulator
MARILLIEPDRLLGNIYAKALTAAKHRVTTSPGAQAAITAADRDRPDLVILELQLVEHSGIEFLYEFRSYPEWQAIPVLIHSQVPPAEFSGSDQLLKAELGVAAYLYKPRTSIHDLLAAVRDQLQVPA